MKRIIYTATYHTNVLGHAVGTHLRLPRQEPLSSPKLCDTCAGINFELLLLLHGGGGEEPEPVSLGTVWSIYRRVHGCVFCRLVAALFVRQNTSEKWRVKPPSKDSEGLLCAYLEVVVCGERRGRLLHLHEGEGRGEEEQGGEVGEGEGESATTRPFLRELNIVFDYRRIIKAKRSPTPFDFVRQRQPPQAVIQLLPCPALAPALFIREGPDGDEDVTTLAQHPHWSAREVPRLADLQLVREWLRICEATHGEQCTHEPSAWPKGLRVIDLETWSITAAPEPCRFLAVRHAGGVAELANDGNFASRMYNYEEQVEPGFLQCHWNSVSQIVRDAANLARTLGLRYLWVGKFCIVVDHARDRARQLDQLGFIYAHAVLVLSVSSKGPPDAGLPRLHEPFKPKGKQQEFCQVSPSVAVVNRLHRRAESRRPLGTLRRVVAFTAQQVVWSCRSSDWSEEQCQEFLPVPATAAVRRPSDSRPAIEPPQGPLTFLPMHAGPFLSYLQGLQLAIGFHQSDRSLLSPREVIDLFHGTSDQDRLHSQRLFYWGIPVNDFSNGLLWCLSGPSTVAFEGEDQPPTYVYPMARRGGSVSEVTIPSWSWFSRPGDVPPTVRPSDSSAERDSGLDWYKVSADGPRLPLSLESPPTQRGETQSQQRPLPSWKPRLVFDLESILYARRGFEDSGTITTNTSANLLRIVKEERVYSGGAVVRYHVLDRQNQSLGTMYCWGRGRGMAATTEMPVENVFAVIAEQKLPHPFAQPSARTSGGPDRRTALEEHEEGYHLMLLMLRHEGSGVYTRVGVCLWSIAEALWMALCPQWITIGLK